MCVCVCARVRVCWCVGMCACMRTCASACVGERARVHVRVCVRVRVCECVCVYISESSALLKVGSVPCACESRVGAAADRPAERSTASAQAALLVVHSL